MLPLFALTTDDHRFDRNRYLNVNTTTLIIDKNEINRRRRCHRSFGLIDACEVIAIFFAIDSFIWLVSELKYSVISATHHEIPFFKLTCGREHITGDCKCVSVSRSIEQQQQQQQTNEETNFFSIHTLTKRHKLGRRSCHSINIEWHTKNFLPLIRDGTIYKLIAAIFRKHYLPCGQQIENDTDIGRCEEKRREEEKIKIKMCERLQARNTHAIYVHRHGSSRTRTLSPTHSPE